MSKSDLFKTLLSFGSSKSVKSKTNAKLREMGFSEMEIRTARAILNKTIHSLNEELSEEIIDWFNQHSKELIDKSKLLGTLTQPVVDHISMNNTLKKEEKVSNYYDNNTSIQNEEKGKCDFQNVVSETLTKPIVTNNSQNNISNKKEVSNHSSYSELIQIEEKISDDSQNIKSELAINKDLMNLVVKVKQLLIKNINNHINEECLDLLSASIRFLNKNEVIDVEDAYDFSEFEFT
jgi:hypothetical protein